MKKVILALALVSVAFIGNAQDKKSGNGKEKTTTCSKPECKDAKGGTCKHMKSGKQCGKPSKG